MTPRYPASDDLENGILAERQGYTPLESLILSFLDIIGGRAVWVTARGDHIVNLLVNSSFHFSPMNREQPQMAILSY